MSACAFAREGERRRVGLTGRERNASKTGNKVVGTAVLLDSVSAECRVLSQRESRRVPDASVPHSAQA